MKTAIAIVSVALLSACATTGTSQSAATDTRELTNLATCYVDGIDEIGAGRTDAGAQRWKQCFAEDLQFTLSFGSFTMTCPGDKCPLPATMTGLARRVAAAKGTYERAGYVATSHHLTAVSVDAVTADSATVKGHLQAWHQRKDGAYVLGLGTWEGTARRTPAGWRIVEERLSSPHRVVIPKTE